MNGLPNITIKSGPSSPLPTSGSPFGVLSDRRARLLADYAARAQISPTDNPSSPKPISLYSLQKSDSEQSLSRAATPLTNKILGNQNTPSPLFDAEDFTRIVKPKPEKKLTTEMLPPIPGASTMPPRIP